MISFLLKEINPHSLRLIKITLLFIISWNSSNRFSFYFLFQNKIEIDIYVFLFNTIIISVIRSGLCSFLVTRLHMMMFTMINTAVLSYRKNYLLSHRWNHGHNNMPFIRIDFHIDLHDFKAIQHYDGRSGDNDPKIQIP